MSKYRKQKEFIFATNSVNDVKNFFKDRPNTDLTQVMDQRGHTALHQCAFLGTIDIMKEYINFMKIYWKNSSTKQKPINELEINNRIRQWVDQTNKQGLTCLHYAAFKGFIEILNYLEQLGANFNIKNNKGLGVLHMASQKDVVKTFIFYHGKVSINQSDYSKTTPLHWAASCGSERVTEYLLSQPHVQINLKDEQQQTPLHLATIQGNTRIVRRLLIAGADRHLKDKSGKQPIEIARENQFVNIQNFLNDDYTWMDHVKFFFNIKNKYEPKKRSLKIPSFFMIMSLLFITVITLALQYHDDCMPIFWAQEATFALLIILYLTLIIHTPKQKRGSYEAIKRMWINKQENPITRSQSQILSSGSSISHLPFEVNSICLRCVQFKPSRSYHCDVCNTCIEQYDHHCPWINNCLGKHNIIRFNCFIVLLFVVLNWLLVISIQFILVILNDEDDRIGFFQINKDFKSKQIFLYGFVSVTLLFYVVFIIPLFFLIVFHIANLFLGKTTYERLSKANQSFLSKSRKQFVGSQLGDSQSKRGKISCYNCAQMCFSRSEQQERLLD